MEILEKINKYFDDNGELLEQKRWQGVDYSFSEIARHLADRLGQEYAFDYDDAIDLSEKMGQEVSQKIQSSVKNAFNMRGTKINKKFEKNEIEDIFNSFIKGMKKGIR